MVARWIEALTGSLEQKKQYLNVGVCRNPLPRRMLLRVRGHDTGSRVGLRSADEAGGGCGRGI